MKIAVDVTVFVVLGILTVVISVLGGRSTENSRYRNAFYLMGFISVLCIVISGFRNYQIQIESAESQEKLNSSLAEIARVQELNTKLQERLVESSATIASLAKASIEEITGGDSFCYVEIRYVGGNLFQAFVSGKGKNPVSGVSIRIVDLDLMQETLPTGQIEAVRKGERSFSFPLPARYTGFMKPLYDIKPTPDTVSKRFNIFILARNGDFTGLLRLRRLEDGSWRLANRVIASFDDKRSGIVLEEIDRGFPVDILKSDPDWKATDKSQRVKIRD
jgi:hypothetical protein